MNTLLIIIASVALSYLLVAGALRILGKLGPVGRKLADACTRAPTLDVIVAFFNFLPWIPAWAFAGWLGVLAAIVGQLIGLTLWIFFHELLNPNARSGPRIVKFLNRTVGRWQNHAALWITALALPLFWFIRAAQYLLYPALVALLDFPRYNQGEWVNVSRQKFSGLVGHDLIWCLYCDWMTGVYSLGAEMLRNVESFWCPIRFYDGKKCENCRVDFPDVEKGWVAPTATMADVEAVMEKNYASGRREWFNHPARLTELTVSAPSPANEPDAPPPT